MIFIFYFLIFINNAYSFVSDQNIHFAEIISMSESEAVIIRDGKRISIERNKIIKEVMIKNKNKVRKMVVVYIRKE